MHVLISTGNDKRTVHEFLERAAHVHLALGHEDITAATGEGRVLLLTDEGQDAPIVAGALILAYEPRPNSLPAGAPERVFLRGAAFRRHVSPTLAMRQLLDACACLPRPVPQLLIAYGGDNWLNRALLDAGMRLAEQVHYFELPDLQRRQLPAPGPAPDVTLSTATPADLAPLAAMDGAIFDTIWHCTVRDLSDLMLRGTIQVARTGSELAGYVSLLVEESGAMIARLAVRREAQGRGIGRRLLLEALYAARAQDCAAVLLNTQASNARSQQLYRSLGFRPTGQRFPVYTLDLPITVPA